ncbi:MAG: c-type cytochrome biogenesis protein CcsB, partial [Angustibacter sp.]
ADALVPALKSSWLIVHVSVAFLAAALLTIAFSFTILYLVKEQLSRRPAFASGKRAAFLGQFPDISVLDTMAYRLHALAFPMWSFTLIGGAIWADKSWGRYWGWDPKEVWTFVIWVVYAAYLHARVTRGWAGRKASWIAILGFICILINFLVVNVYFVGKHSYGGVG